jgi:hypothetical protein
MNLKSIVLGVTIFVLTLFVTIYGVNMIYSEPQYEDYCDFAGKAIISDEGACINAGGIWQAYQPRAQGEPAGYCDQNFKCNNEYEYAQKIYSKKVFFIAVPLGILIVLLGAYFFSLDAVGVGIMAGGVGTMLRGVSGFWRYSEDWLKFLISLAGLIVVIYFAYKFSEKLGFGKVKKK